MPVNNSPARRAQRHTEALARSRRRIVSCRVCGRRHATTRPCWGPIPDPPPTTGRRGFWAVLARLAARGRRRVWR